MRIPSLDRSPPAVLVLGPRGEQLARLLRALGVVADFAERPETAFERFTERGGHDLVLAYTEPEFEDLARRLTAVDPELRVVRVEPEERLDRWLAAVLR